MGNGNKKEGYEFSDLSFFTKTGIVSFDDNLDATYFILSSENIDISYDTVSNFQINIDMTIEFKNGNIEEVKRNYTCRRRKIVKNIFPTA
jgi:hypothetical protein